MKARPLTDAERQSKRRARVAAQKAESLYVPDQYIAQAIKELVESEVIDSTLFKKILLKSSLIQKEALQDPIKAKYAEKLLKDFFL